MDDILKMLGWDYDQLNSMEKETLYSWVKDLSEKTLTPDEILSYIKRLRIAVDTELATENLTKNKDIFLKARLANYIVIEAFLEGPVKAKQALEMYIKTAKNRG